MNHPWLKHIITLVYGKAGAKHVTIGTLLKDVLLVVFLILMGGWIFGVLWLS